jgi:hypothetical protein
MFGGGHAHYATGRTVRYARDQPLAARKRQAGFGIAEAHQGTRLITRHEAATMNGNFTAGNRRRRRDSFDAWIAVFFCRPAQA